MHDTSLVTCYHNNVFVGTNNHRRLQFESDQGADHVVHRMSVSVGVSLNHGIDIIQSKEMILICCQRINAAERFLKCSQSEVPTDAACVGGAVKVFKRSF